MSGCSTSCLPAGRLISSSEMTQLFVLSTVFRSRAAVHHHLLSAASSCTVLDSTSKDINTENSFFLFSPKVSFSHTAELFRHKSLVGVCAEMVVSEFVEQKESFRILTLDVHRSGQEADGQDLRNRSCDSSAVGSL